MLSNLTSSSSLNLQQDTLKWVRNKGQLSVDLEADLKKHNFDEAKYIDSLNLSELRNSLFLNIHKCLKMVKTIGDAKRQSQIEKSLE